MRCYHKREDHIGVLVQVMELLKGIGRTRGLCICCTIHSPTPRTFKLFDRLMLLVGGNLVYFGPCGMQAVDFFLGQVLRWRKSMVSIGAC